MKRVLLLLVGMLLLSGCGTTSTSKSNDGHRESSPPAPVVLKEHTEPTGIKEHVENGPVVGYRPPMPPQKRITSPPIKKQTIVENLRVPWDIEFTDDGQFLLFTERPGRVGLVNVADTNPDVKILFNRGEVLHWGEGGLMGLALHPEFKSSGGSNNWIYLCETYGDYDTAKNRIIRVRPERDVPVHQISGDQSITVEPLIENMPAASYHDGCRLEFGPGGNLYATMGDAGTPTSAQDLKSWAGKILRMRPNGEPTDDNPFTGDKARPYVYSYGHRNPQGIAWHPQTGQLYSSEHGPSGEFGLSGHDEVNRIIKGENYGWPTAVGAPGIDQYRDPVLMFPHPHLPPAGMAFTRAYDRSSDRTSLFVGSLRAETLLRAVFSDRGGITSIERWFERDHFSGTLGRIRAVTHGPDHTLYLATSNRDGRGSPREGDDKIVRLNQP